MIAGCIERMTADACGGCERRDACAQLFSGLFGRGRPSALRRAPRGQSGPRDVGRNLFFEMLGEVARSVERNIKARQQTAPPARAAATPSKPATRPPAEPGPFQRVVEAHLEPLLGSGPIGIDSVARALGLSRQTLYRRLKAEGVTFEEVLDGLRRRLALRLIRDEGVSVKEAAWRLGFSDPAAFSRAYKRWTGASPTRR